MIDVHCHLLAGIDDGASTLAQSLLLARHAVADGITHMVVTPHMHPGMYDNDLATIAGPYVLFKAALARNGIDLKIAMAAEVRIGSEILSMLEKESLPLYTGSEGQRTVLLELPHSHVPPGTEQMLKWLLAHGIGVLMAHPERNKEIMHNYKKLEPFLNLGCKLQLTSGSVSGRFGQGPRLASEYMLQRAWADILASDSHNLHSRPPELSDGMEAAAAIIGAKKAHELVFEKPWALVSGMFGNA